MSYHHPFKGTRWFKCDLHLHTPASKCFDDQSVTAYQWVQKAIEQGLDCVAITDHNSGEKIDDIKIAAKEKGITVFPGVEITCDTSKIHLLVLFDLDKDTQDIEDFLIKCGEDRESFGEQSAYTNKSVFEIAQIAYESGGIVIPAHIDEFNGLNNVSIDNLKGFLKLNYINAVQIVHPELLNNELNINGYSELVAQFNQEYGNPTIPISESIIKEWHTASSIAMNSNQALLTFSDNPNNERSSKHGLNGIGSKYTWIKMDEIPSLEGLRQAFLLPQFRVKNQFESREVPYKFSELWIKSLTVTNTTITGTEPVTFDFSPQLTTIIGGRGSGKSSILKFIRGLFNKTTEIKQLKEIYSDFDCFFQKEDLKTKLGVLNENSSLSVEFVRNNIIYKITNENILDETHKPSIHKYSETESWTEVKDERFLDFFKFEQYSQKQIYEIAQEPNSLLNIIDKAIHNMQSLFEERDLKKKEYLEISTNIRKITQEILYKGMLNTEINDINDKISIINGSGISELISEKNKFDKQSKIINSFSDNLKAKDGLLNDIIENLELDNIDYSETLSEYSEDLSLITEKVQENITSIRDELINLSEKIKTTINEYDLSLEASQWQRDFNANKSIFAKKNKELNEKGINDLSEFETLNKQKSEKEEKLSEIGKLEAELNGKDKKKLIIKNEYIALCKSITEKRKEFLNTVLRGQNVQIRIKPFRNKANFEERLRAIIKRETEFRTDIDYLTELCFNGIVETKIEEVKNIFLRLKNGGSVSELGSRFANLVYNLSDSDIDEIQILMPEDELIVEYKPENSSTFKSLVSASPGQKTTAILTFILSYGVTPLLLDQPEDDLDNKLVYDLIVERLKRSKEKRQIIVITHNANIPVNGDAEFIISMDSESKLLRTFRTGSVEDPLIKKEICNVMEGSENAFSMRSKRYNITEN